MRGSVASVPHLTRLSSSSQSPKQLVGPGVRALSTRSPKPGEDVAESEMTVKPQTINPKYKGSGKLAGKVALITGGDSGIGRAVAVHFAREGAAGIVIVYKGGHEDEDAKVATKLVESEGSQCITVPIDVGDAEACKSAVKRTIQEYGRLDILVNNAGETQPLGGVEAMTPERLKRIFDTNLFSMFYMAKAAMPYLKSGASIINTASVGAYTGLSVLGDYAATKGGVVSFTRSLAQELVEKGIRVNGVAPGPIWTPLIATRFGEAFGTEFFGKDVPMKRAGQPSEVAPAYVFLASDVDSSYVTGQMLHPNGGTILNV